MNEFVKALPRKSLLSKGGAQKLKHTTGKLKSIFKIRLDSRGPAKVQTMKVALADN